MAHVIICGVVGYAFRERTEVHQHFDPPLETTTVTTRHHGNATFLIERNLTTITFPVPVLLYGAMGLLGLLIAFCFELYQLLSRS